MECSPSLTADFNWLAMAKERLEIRLRREHCPEPRARHRELLNLRIRRQQGGGEVVRSELWGSS